MGQLPLWETELRRATGGSQATGYHLSKRCLAFYIMCSEGISVYREEAALVNMHVKGDL